MKYKEIIEQIGMIGSTVPTATGTTPGLTGNTAVLQDPRLKAAQLAQAKKQKDEQKKTIQDQIAQLQKQLSDLNRAP